MKATLSSEGVVFVHMTSLKKYKDKDAVISSSTEFSKLHKSPPNLSYTFNNKPPVPKYDFYLNFSSVSVDKIITVWYNKE